MHVTVHPVFDLDRIGAGLPAGGLVDRIAVLATPQRGLRAVIEAPPGSGKTTVIPPALAVALAPQTTAAEAPGTRARILVSQPRRVAARAAAHRLAHLSGQEVGGAVGYTVRGDRRTGRDTQIEFATTGVILRRLLNDPELSGVDAVVLDEVHERSLETDLSFAMLRELVDLRDDLSLLVMSATLDAEDWARRLAGTESASSLGSSASGDSGDTGDSGARSAEEPHAEEGSADGGSAPILRVAAQPHPLTVRWSPPPRRAVDERGVRPDFLTHVAATVDDALAAGPGDVLVFAPGHREVDRIAAQVRSRCADVDVLTLTGSTPRREQSAVLAGGAPEGRSHAGGTPAGRIPAGGVLPGGDRTDRDHTDGDRTGGDYAGTKTSGFVRRRVVVATSVAESALTVPGVRIVVDSCLARVPHFDTGRGIGGLTTVRVSKASGDQRAGRAAREAPGTVWRCSSEAEWAAFPAHTSPEILTADLTGAVLDLAVWGSPGGQGLPLPTPLPDLPLRAAARTLHGLGALESPDTAARATAFGRALAAVPADPRTARGLLFAAPVIGARQAAECAALLSLDVRADGGDLTALLRRARNSHDAAPAGWRREVQRLERIARAQADTTQPDTRGSSASTAGSSAARDLGIVLALSRPDLIAQLRAGSDSDYLLASGTGAQLQRGSALHGEDWIVVADAAVVGGRTLIRAGVGIDEETALWAGSALRSVRDSAEWRDGRLRGRRIDSLGAITLTSTPVGVTEESASAGIADAVRTALGRLGDGDSPGAAFAGLAGEGEADSFALLRGRLGLLHQVLGVPWPDVRSASLADTLDDWLGLEIRRAARMLASGNARAAGPKRTVRLRLHDALQGLLPWPEAVDLDRLVPLRVAVPSGSSVRLDYPQPEEHTTDDGPRTSPPVLAVKLQEMFGASEGPAVIDGRVPVLVHLLSPARRPLAVTADLASFWSGAYAHVRAENRGRYPKHPWPEDPRSAPPTKHTSKRSSRT